MNLGCSFDSGSRTAILSLLSVFRLKVWQVNTENNICSLLLWLCLQCKHSLEFSLSASVWISKFYLSAQSTIQKLSSYFKKSVSLPWSAKLERPGEILWDKLSFNLWVKFTHLFFTTFAYLESMILKVTWHGVFQFLCMCSFTEQVFWK